MILLVIVLAAFLILPYQAFAQPARNNTSDVGISIEEYCYPSGIAVHPNTDTVYVTNADSDTVSVINATN
ncbi:MAG: hypothetical protein WA941_09030 [Nitrososphaeraceae archaeon]